VLKPDSVLPEPREADAAWVANGVLPHASLLECSPPADGAVLPLAPFAARAASEAAPVNLDDIGNARALAVLSVPPQSRVLAVGIGRGEVARALAARACQVWGIDVDSPGTRLAAPWCEGLLIGDIETANLEILLDSERADVILFIDVLEQLGDRAAAIRRVVPFLAPGGRIVLSVPQVDQAAIPMSRPAGGFLPTWADAPLHARPSVRDRWSLDEVLRDAGLRVIDEARVAGSAVNTRDVVLTVVPGVGVAVEPVATLVSTLTDHLQRVESECQRLRERARDLDMRIAQYADDNHCLRQGLDQAREWHQRAAEAVTAVSEDLRRSARDCQRAEEQLSAATDALARCQVERRFLRDDVVVKDAYLATLREQLTGHQENTLQYETVLRQHASECQQSQEETRLLTARLDAVAAEHAAAARTAAELALANHDLRGDLARAHEELHRVHTSIADTLAQPRYRIADRVNAWARHVRFLHAALKRAWSARHRAP
jgi:2-polyprenyl-3-methyl-5-hydroxy-6-metoxy-1,4-benzoquinol methylase/cell division septum initiation protein DivIVA